MSTAVMQPPIIQRPPTSRPKISNELLRNSIIDPVLFSENWLKVDVWSKQRDILRSIQNNRKTAVKACHASSKTFTAALATLWWLARWEEAIVITTAPTQKQVEALLWAEIHKLIRQSVYPFPKPTISKLSLGPKRYAFGFTTSVDSGDEGVKFQGFHAAHILLILDEAPGVDGKIWEAIKGILSAGDTRMLALGNPVIASGPFYDAFGINSETWNNFTISAFDTPNLEGVTLDQLLAMPADELEFCPTPYLVSRHWVREMYRELGPEHPLFKARVLGEFPSQSPDSLLSVEWLEKAKNKQALDQRGKFYAGIDVAGPGEDETVLTIRQGEHVLFLQAYANPDPRGDLAIVLNPFKEFIELNFDVVGIGYYMALHFEDLGFIVNHVNVGEGSSDKDRFYLKKAEYYWGLRMRLESGEISGLTDASAIAQLSGIRYKPNSRGQIEIESKDDARKRGVKSPDRAESVMLAFAPVWQNGLFDYWEQQAGIIQTPPTLAAVQKENAGFDMKYKDALGTKEGSRMGAIATASNTPSECPNCGNRLFILNGEGIGRCGCGYVGGLDNKHLRKVNFQKFS